MIESAMALATLVQLLGVWRAERREENANIDGIDADDLLEWMRHHRFDEVAELLESNSSIVEDLRNESGAINSKLDQILGILSGGDVNIEVSPELVELMDWLKPKKKTVTIEINGSLVEAMVRCIDYKLEGLALRGGVGCRQLVGLKMGEEIPLEVEDDSWPMMKDDLAHLAEVDIFDCEHDYDRDYDRFLVTRKLGEFVESTLRPHLEKCKEESEE